MTGFLRNFPNSGLALSALPGFATLAQSPLTLFQKRVESGAGFAPKQLKAQLFLDTHCDPRSDEIRDQFVGRTKAMLEDLDWLGIAKMIEQLDQRRVRLPNGVSLLDEVLTELRHMMSTTYENPNFFCEEVAYDIADVMLAAIFAAHEAHPRNYALAALLCRFLIDRGWAARDSKQMVEPDDGGWTALNQHFAAARRLVARYDAVAFNSPLLAEVQLLVNIGLSEAPDRFVQAVDDWVELDPTDWRVHQKAAFFALDRWFGGDAEAVRMARHCAELSQDVFQDSAYFVITAHAMGHDQEVARHVDVPRFVASLDGLLSRNQSNSYAQTRALAALDDALTLRNPAASAHDDPDAQVMRELRAHTAPVLRTQVRQLDPTVIEGHGAKLRAIMSYAFEEELRRGATVQMDAGHILITEPDELPVAV